MQSVSIKNSLYYKKIFEYKKAKLKISLTFFLNESGDNFGTDTLSHWLLGTYATAE